MTLLPNFFLSFHYQSFRYVECSDRLLLIIRRFCTQIISLGEWIFYFGEKKASPFGFLIVIPSKLLSGSFMVMGSKWDTFLRPGQMHCSVLYFGVRTVNARS